MVDGNISRLDLGRRRGDAVGGGHVEGNGPARAYGRGNIRRDGVEALASPRRDPDIGTGAGPNLCEMGDKTNFSSGAERVLTGTFAQSIHGLHLALCMSPKILK